MAYLTYSEYEELSSRMTDADQFSRLINKASQVLDNVTNHYYQRHDIQKDNIWRVGKFKAALVSQIDFFDEVGGSSYEEINSSPQSFSAGRTSVSNATRHKSASGTNENKSLIAEDVHLILEGSGLLYSGVATW